MEADEGRIDSKSSGAVVVDLDKAREEKRTANAAQAYVDPVKTAALKFWLLLFVAVFLLAMVSKRIRRSY